MTINREPAVLIGIVAAVILAIVQTLVGQGVLGSDLGDTVAKALDPNHGGWALPIITAVATRFFVYSPATVKAVAAKAAATGDPTVTTSPP